MSLVATLGDEYLKMTKLGAIFLAFGWARSPPWTSFELEVRHPPSNLIVTLQLQSCSCMREEGKWIRCPLCAIRFRKGMVRCTDRNCAEQAYLVDAHILGQWGSLQDRRWDLHRR